MANYKFEFEFEAHSFNYIRIPVPKGSAPAAVVDDEDEDVKDNEDGVVSTAGDDFGRDASSTVGLAASSFEEATRLSSALFAVLLRLRRTHAAMATTPRSTIMPAMVI